MGSSTGCCKLEFSEKKLRCASNARTMWGVAWGLIEAGTEGDSFEFEVTGKGIFFSGEVFEI
jgi:hypothetical protein